MPREKSPARLELDQRFLSLAQRHSGKVLFTMDQMEFKEHWEEHAGGKCNGISVLWLRHQHNELQSRAFAFFDEKKNAMVQLLEVRYREMTERNDELWDRAQQYFKADANERKTNFKDDERRVFEEARQLSGNWRREAVLRADPFAHALHERMHVEGQVNSYRDSGEERERVNAFFREYGMDFESLKVFAGGWGAGHSDLGKFVAKEGTASMLHTGKHAMAACNTLGKPRFFDSNFGALEFPNGSRLGSFLSDFFKIPVVNTSYSGAEKYTKLRVMVERYRYQRDRVYTIR